MNTLGQKMRVEFALWATKQFLSIINLDTWFNVHICELKHSLSSTNHVHNHCAKYEHPPSKLKKEFSLQGIRQIFSLFNLDLWLKGEKVSEYDQEMPQSQWLQIIPWHPDEETQTATTQFK